jgi:hypothetical protein
MKLYKHYFDKSDTPFIPERQPKAKYHTVWMRKTYEKISNHKVYMIKFLGFITIYRRDYE